MSGAFSLGLDRDERSTDRDGLSAGESVREDNARGRRQLDDLAARFCSARMADVQRTAGSSVDGRPFAPPGGPCALSVK